MDNEAEKGIIGALIIDSSAVGSVENLSPEMFTDALLGRIFHEYRKSFFVSEQLTILQVKNMLSEDFPNDDIGSILKECAMIAPMSTQIKSYAKIVHDNYRAKKLSEILNRCRPKPTGIDEQIGLLMNDVEALKRNEEAKLKRIDKIVAEYRGQYFTEKKEKFLEIGFPRIDEALGGLEGGEMVVVGARPAVGKSAFVFQIARNLTEKGMKVAIYNLEMKDQQEYERLISSTSGIDLNRIRRANCFVGDEEERFGNANDKLMGLDLYLRSGSSSISQIRAETKAIGFDLIIIDYLQLLRPDTYRGDRRVEVGDISRAIKGLAMDRNIPIIALSQLNRISEGRDTKEPTMSELRDAGDIEQDAGVIFLLWCTDECDDTMRGCKIEKNRQGKKAKIPMKFIGEQMRFEELDGEIKASRRKDDDDDCPFK